MKQGRSPTSWSSENVNQLGMQQKIEFHVKEIVKPVVMKKLIFALVVVAMGLLASSCNKQACPAYVHVDTEMTDPQS